MPLVSCKFSFRTQNLGAATCVHAGFEEHGVVVMEHERVIRHYLAFSAGGLDLIGSLPYVVLQFMFRK